jgi:AP-3 complex subunit mu
VYGEVMCNTRLTGVPDITLVFNKPAILDDVSLHRCVRIARFKRERVISFVPPDGAFKLMTYRVKGVSQLPIAIRPTLHYQPGRCNVNCTVLNKAAGDRTLTSVSIVIPFPKAATQNIQLSANVGIVKVDTVQKVCKWEIPKLTKKDKMPQLQGTVTFKEQKIMPAERPTLRCEWVCKTMTASGLKVDSISVKSMKKKPFKGIRSLTQAGTFQIRT